jgi:hypothetical protein
MRAAFVGEMEHGREQFWMGKLAGPALEPRGDKSGSHERPHKPVLLLSIIDLWDRGVITCNEVPLSGERVAAFKRYFAVVRRENDQPTVQNPFFHLCGDKFWQLVPALGEAPIYRASAACTWRNRN